MHGQPTLERPPEQLPDYRFSFEPHSGRVRAEFAGITVVDSRRAMVMRETRLAPVYYFPREDVRMDLMVCTERHSHCPFKGNASYWSLTVGDRRVDDAMWSYEHPLPESASIAGFVAFMPNKWTPGMRTTRRLPSRMSMLRVTATRC